MSENKKNRIADGADENRQPQSAGEGKDSSSARTESTQGTHTGNGDFRERDGERQEGGEGCESGGQGESGNARHPSHDELVQKKIICSLAYVFGILFFLPLAIYPNDDFAKFHANQSLVVLLVSVIGGVPMGIGIFAVWPLAKKLGKKNLTALGFLLYAIGSAICWIAPTNMAVVLIGQFIKNIGGLPCAYVFMALFADALDNLEWKNGFRCDGIAMSAYSVIITAAAGVVTGIFNGAISGAGYIAPYTATAETLEQVLQEISASGLVTQLDPSQLTATADGLFTIAIDQSDAVKTAFVIFFVGIEAIAGFVFALMLMPVTVEKTIDKKQAIIRARQKAECEARGEVWIEPEIRAAEEQKKMDEEAEEAYRKELKERCEKKGLDFDAELQKHIAATETKEAKRIENERKAAEKAEAKAKKAKEKREAKIAAMTPEQLADSDAKAKAKAQRDEAAWQLEKAQGEAIYEKMQAELAAYEAKHAEA